MTDIQGRRRTGGRSARVRESVLAATLQAVVRDGAEAVSIAEVASEAGVHETSIYRRWKTRENLVLDALLTYSEDQLPIPDTGMLRTDLFTFTRSVAAYLTSPLGAALARSMSSAVDGPDVAAARGEFWGSRRATAAVMVSRAAERGEVAADVEAGLVLELLVAPLHFRMLLTGRPLDDDFLHRLVDQVLTGVISSN